MQKVVTKIHYKETSSSSSLFQIQIFVVLVVFFALTTLFLSFLTFSSRQKPQPARISSKFPENSNISDEASGKLFLFRLPANIRPVHYDLRLQVFLPYRKGFDFGTYNFTTRGDVQIRIVCLQATDQIVLNAKNLTFEKTDILVWDGTDNGTIAVLAVNRYQHERDDILMVELILSCKLYPGHDYYVSVKYYGAISDVWTGGLFRTEYDDNHGQRRSVKSFFVFL